MLEVTILSVLQGIAEFLPISSSGHLVVVKEFLGLGDVGIRLDVFLHVGTLIAVVLFYFATLRSLALNMISKGERKEALSYVGKILLSAIPAGAVGVFLNDFLSSLFSSPRMVGLALAFTSIVLISTRFFSSSKTSSVSFKSAFLMGLAQAVAIIPGVSRSGMTLSMAKALGVDSGKAAEFSFLMSIPPIAGAALLEVIKSLECSSAVPEVSWGLTLYGACVSAAIGYISLALLLKALKANAFWMFGLYTFVVSAIVLIAM